MLGRPRCMADPQAEHRCRSQHPLSLRLRRRFRPSLSFQGRFRIADFDQSRARITKLPAQSVVSLVPLVSVLVPVDFLGFHQKTFDPGFETLLFSLHAGVVPRLVFRDIHLHLGAVDGHCAQLHKVGLVTQLQNLQKQGLKRLQMKLAERIDPRRVRELARGQIPECNVSYDALLDLSGRVDPYDAGVHGHLQHHGRMV